MNISIKDVLQRIRIFFILYLLLLGCCLIVKIFCSREAIFFGVNSLNSPFADFIAPFVTDIGNGWTIIVLAALLALFNFRAAFLMISSYALTSLLAQVIKNIVKAPRPKLYFQHQLSHIHFVQGQYVDTYNSFPSGHTVTAFSAAVTAAYLCKNKQWSILFLLIAVAVGYSRIYLSEHFFEDVMAGSAIGVFITIFWIRWIDSRQFLNRSGWSRGLLQRKQIR